MRPEGAADSDDFIPDRSSFSGADTVEYLWHELGLPPRALPSLHLTGSGHGFRSSFRIGHLAQNAVALSSLTAALVDSLRWLGREVRNVTVPLESACLEFISERLCTVEGGVNSPSLPPIGGLHRTSDGYVRVHDGFPNHRNGTLRLLGLGENATRDDVAREVAKWKALDLEDSGRVNKLAIYALRSFDEWDALPQARALPDCPISITKLDPGGNARLPDRMMRNPDRCLRGLRVLDLCRVLAGPVAGRTLASHGAEVLWVTSPNLPDLPDLDRDTARGKRSIQLDLDRDADGHTLRGLIKDSDVFLQAYRPGALAARGFGPDDLISLNPNIIYATVSAFGSSGPWADRRGFDSLVQTCSGMNVAEAAFFSNVDGEVARPAPCQPLDHASGQFLAAGIAAAVYKRALEGGSWKVEVSLAGTMKYLRSLEQVECGPNGFEGLINASGEGHEECFEERESEFGRMRALRPPAAVEGAMPGFDGMSRPLGSDEAEWL